MPALVNAPVPEITPLKVELRLSVLPTVRVCEAARTTLPEFRALPTLVSAAMVWVAPTLKVAPSATLTVARVPRASARFEFNVPAVILT